MSAFPFRVRFTFIGLRVNPAMKSGSGVSFTLSQAVASRQRIREKNTIRNIKLAFGFQLGRRNKTFERLGNKMKIFKVFPYNSHLQ